MNQTPVSILLSLAILCFSWHSSRADFIFSVQTSPLLSDAATPQRLSLFMSWNGTGRSDVIGMNLFMEIRNPLGASSVPTLTGSPGTLQGFGYSASQAAGGSFVTSGPTIWDAILPTNPVTVSGAVPESSNIRRASVNVLSSNLIPFNFSTVGANAPRLVAQFQVNTQGIANQRYQIFIGEQGGSSTDIIFSDGSFTPTGSSLNLDVGTAVPEGNCLPLMMMAIVGAMLFRPVKCEE